MAADIYKDGFMTWEETFEADASAPERKILPAGTYPFIVEDVERTYVSDKPKSDGSVSKFAGCPMANVTFRITGKTEEGEEIEITRHENFILHKKCQWKISQLYISVGLAKQGEKLQMNWPALITRAGQCEISVNEYTKKNGEKGQSNQIERFCDPATTAPAWKRGF